MQVQEHLKLSTAAALITAPLLKQDIWIPFTASLLIDVDHYLWHAVTYRTLSLRAAVRYFGQADPPQLPQARLLHHPLVLGALLFLAVRLRSRVLALVLAGLLFHVSLDIFHVSQMNSLKYSLREQANNICRNVVRAMLLCNYILSTFRKICLIVISLNILLCCVLIVMRMLMHKWAREMGPVGVVNAARTVGAINLARTGAGNWVNMNSTNGAGYDIICQKLVR